MSPSERRTAARAALLLLLASSARWGWERSRAEPLSLPDTAGVRDSLLAGGREASEEAERRSRPLAPGERLDPNRAPEAELDRLPGIGPATARAMVEERERRGGFDRVEDLLDVRGIGPATLRRIGAHLEVGSRPRIMAGRSRGAGRPGSGAEFRNESGRGASGPTPPSPSRPLDLNRATEEELRLLPGVGPAIAGRILALRERRGGFGSADDLLEVRGIGPATIERLRPLIRP